MSEPLPLTKKQAMGNRVAIYAICFINLVYLLPSVAMADMVDVFSPVPQATVMLTLSLPCLTSVLGSIALPAFQHRYSLKTVTLAALALAVFAGAVSVAFHGSFPVILAASAFQGLSYGVFVTVYPLLSAILFPKGDQPGVLAGSTAMIQAGRVAILFFGGLLASIRWYYAFYMILLCALAFLIVLFFLTDPGLTPKKEKKGSASDLMQLIKSPAFLYLAVTASIFLILYYNVATYASLYIQENGLGNPSATGTASSIASGVAVFTSLLSAKVRKYTGRFTGGIAALVLGFGLLLPGIWVSLPAIGAGMIIASIGKSQQMPHLMGEISACGDESMRAVAMAFVQTGISLGYFLSPAISTFLGGIAGSGQPTDVYAATGATGMAMGLLMIAVECIRSRGERKKRA